MRLAALLLVLVLLAAWITRPDSEQAEAEMRGTILAALATEDIRGKDAVTSAALLGCRLNPEGCYELVRAGLTTEFDDRIVYSVFEITGFDRHGLCYGAFTTFVCPGGFAPK